MRERDREREKDRERKRERALLYMHWFDNWYCFVVLFLSILF